MIDAVSDFLSELDRSDVAVVRKSNETQCVASTATPLTSSRKKLMEEIVGVLCSQWELTLGYARDGVRPYG